MTTYAQVQSRPNALNSSQASTSVADAGKFKNYYLNSYNYSNNGDKIESNFNIYGLFTGSQAGHDIDWSVLF